MGDDLGTYEHFRLNFEQQGKRAKALLQAAHAEDPEALARFTRAEVSKPGRSGAPLKLADAHRVIARELRFDDWAHLKRHIASMTVERKRTSALDADHRTLHIRCGSDLRAPLQAAGFGGDFHEHSYPYLIGPVRDEGPGVLEERARFLVDTYAGDRSPPLQYEAVLAGLTHDERILADSAGYERVVIWSEGDVYDQLVLVRLLGHYARHRRPARIELVNSGDFPGVVRFVGLGQLPPEALRLLWKTRESVGPAELVLGHGAWRALASDDPRALAAIARSATPALPLLAPALRRHLSELPAIRTGLSFTERLALSLIAEQPRSLERVFGRLNYFDDPLPGQGDSQVRDRVLGMEVQGTLVFTRAPGVDAEGRARPPWTDVLTITDLGRRVLAGEVDFRSLAPRARWVGGVRIAAGSPDWRWDAAEREVLLNPGPVPPLQPAVKETDPPAEDEGPLIARARGGDVRAFEALYRRHVGRVHGLCLRMTRQHARADDCTQQAFINAWRSLPNFEGRSAFGSWLHRIAMNVVLSQRPATFEAVPEPREVDTEWSLDTPMEVDAIEAAIDALPSGARDVLILSGIYGYPHAEVAAMLGVAEGTCKAQLFRARALLRKALGLEDDR